MRGGGSHYTHITKYALASRSWKCHNKARNFIARASDQIEPLTNNSGKNIQILSSYFTYFFSWFLVNTATYCDCFSKKFLHPNVCLRTKEICQTQEKEGISYYSAKVGINQSSFTFNF